MANLITLIIILAMGYLIWDVISRKKQELFHKGLRQQEQFIKETQSLLQTPVPHLHPSFNVNYRTAVIENFTEQGYKVSEHTRDQGIDFIGLKEKELLMVRCESDIKEVRIADIKTFIADCTVYIDHNPMMGGRLNVRIYATNRPITEEVQTYVRENPASIRLLAEV